jgi:hypothetical protein
VVRILFKEASQDVLKEVRFVAVCCRCSERDRERADRPRQTSALLSIGRDATVQVSVCCLRVIEPSTLFCALLLSLPLF